MKRAVKIEVNKKQNGSKKIVDSIFLCQSSASRHFECNGEDGGQSGGSKIDIGIYQGEEGDRVTIVVRGGTIRWLWNKFTGVLRC